MRFFWEYCLNKNKGERQKTLFAVLAQVLAAYRVEYPAAYEPSITAILKLLNNCKPRRIYVLFLEAVLAFLQESVHTGACAPSELEQYATFSTSIHTAMQSVDIFNCTPQAALETLSEQLILT